MTAPVTQQDSGKIAMTAPAQQGDGRTWRVRFIMPSRYTMETLPKPHNPDVKLKEIPAKRYAVIRFSGMAGEDSLKLRTKELNEGVRRTTFVCVRSCLRFLQPALDPTVLSPQRGDGRNTCIACLWKPDRGVRSTGLR
jgi:hypothetical protein